MSKNAAKKLNFTDEQACQETITRIARELLGIATLQSRGNDRLDFYDLGVESVCTALHAAYQAGREARK